MVLASLAFVLATHEDPLALRVDAIVAEALKEGAKRFSVSVVQDGKLVYAKGFSDDGKTNADSVFRLASVTKQFTASLIVLLAREKKVGYEDTLAKFIPEVPKAWQSVTVRQLMTHTSGIPSYTDQPSFDSIVRTKVTPTEIWQYAATKKEMDFAPGMGWHYNNTGYALLGSIIEKVTGKPYFSVLQTKIFGPLRMKRTGSEDKFAVVESYTAENKPSDPMSMSWPYSAGAIVSTVKDMAKWDAALRGKFFTPAEKALMFSPDPVGRTHGHAYGFGWAALMDGDKLLLNDHGGGINGFSTMIIRSHQKGASVIVLCAKEGAYGPEIARKIMTAVEPDLYPKEAPPAVDNNKDATDADRALLEGLLAGRVDEARFDPAFLARVSPAQLLKGGEQLKSLGALSGFRFLSEEKKEGATARAYGLKLGGTEFRLMATVNSSGKIVGLLISPK